MRFDWVLIFLQTYIVLYLADIADLGNRVEPTPPPSLRSNYDFVIIGGDSAGSVLANRLSGNENWTVLLIEAGSNDPYATDITVIATEVVSTPVSWPFKTYPLDNYCTGKENHQCPWPRGKTLGGSSTVNGMMYYRGNKRDYNHWEETGNAGWNYESVLSYFKKSEDMRIKEYQGSPYHNVDGYLTIEYYVYRSPINDYLIQAGIEMGYRIVDHNGANQTGFSYTFATLRDGLRCSTAKAFLRPAWRRRNLHISTDSFVEKILTRKDGDVKIAYGVQFCFQSDRYVVKANREVILSAGAVQSPQVLMLSGIGPRDRLEELNIPVIHDVPGVGRNVQDHVTITELNFVVSNPRNYTERRPFSFDLKNSVDEGLTEFAKHTGPMYGYPYTEAVAFINTKYANASGDHPDIQLWISTMTGIPTNRSSYLITPVLIKLRSKGYINLNATNPEGSPIID